MRRRLTPYESMSTKALVRELTVYSQNRSGEIAELTQAAAARIASLDARIKALEKTEDDLK